MWPVALDECLKCQWAGLGVNAAAPTVLRLERSQDDGYVLADRFDQEQLAFQGRDRDRPAGQ